MRVRLPPESSSARRSSPRVRTPEWARVAGRVLFGVVVPLACFGVLLAAAPDLWLWPMALFVLTCVAAYVTSCLRAPRDDGFDAALHGAMFAATAFGGVWGASAGALACVAGLFAIGVSVNAGFVALLALGAAAPGVFVAYLWRLGDRWPRHASKRTTTRAHTFERLVGFLGPGVVCLSLFAVIATRARAVEQGVIANEVSVELDSLRVWRWIAPGRQWSEIDYARQKAQDPLERVRLDDAYVALKGEPAFEPAVALHR